MGCVIALTNLMPVRPFFAKLFPMRLVADLHPDFRMRLQMRIGDRIGRVDVQVQPVRTLFQMIGRKTQYVGRGCANRGRKTPDVQGSGPQWIKMSFDCLIKIRLFLGVACQGRRAGQAVRCLAGTS